MAQRPGILIVGEQAAGPGTLRGILGALDLDIVEAGDEKEALAAARHHDFALAILDPLVPDAAACELANLLRGDPRTRALPVIFVTAAGEEERLFKACDAGAADCIVKPYDRRVLLPKVAIFLELHRANAAVAADAVREPMAEVDGQLAFLAAALR